MLIGRPANLRRWAASQLGAGPPTRRGGRPRTDLSSVARSFRYARATSSFQQRLVYERLMAVHVPMAARRDLKRPAYLGLDQADAYPRLVVREREPGRADLFGPFPDRRSAERAKLALEKRYGLRPCHHAFEPDPASSLGLGCLHGQLASCSAPCLARLSGDEYRALARRAAALLDSAEERAGTVEEIPSLVTSVACPALVASRRKLGTRGRRAQPEPSPIELYPVVAGNVCEDAALLVADQELPRAIAALVWPQPQPPQDDTAWLLAWLGSSPRGCGLVSPRAGEAAASLVERIRKL